MKKVEDEIIREFSVQRGKAVSGGVFKVIRGFYLQVRNGPNVPVLPGSTCELSQEISTTLFMAGKIEPINLPREFKVLRNFKATVGDSYLNLCTGDEVSLEREEALDLMRKGIVKPIFKSEVSE